MTDRRTAAIVSILEQLPELVDPVRAGNGDGQTWLRLMPHEPSCHIRDWKPPTCTCSLQCALEVQRLLYVMRDSSLLSLMPDGSMVPVRTLWWHLNQRYMRCSTSTRELGWRSGRYSGLPEHSAIAAQPGAWHLALAAERTRRKNKGTMIRVRVVTWDPQVRRPLLDRATRWLSDAWSLPIDPRLPAQELVA